MTYDDLRYITQLQSLAWTFPLVILCWVVVWDVRRQTFNALKHWCKSQMDWIILGIALSFTGKIVESLWWFIPWTLSYLEHPEWVKFNNAGVFFNIVFRQAFFTAAAYCHLRAFVAPELGKGLRAIHRILLISMILGQLYPLALYYIK